tara:strand:+ start:40 stop:534 length:495 start_codon:yes stop_codon:yes gene_type:complete
MFNLFKSRPKNLINENGLNEILWKSKDSEGRYRIELLYFKKNGLLDGDFFYFKSLMDSPLSTRYGDEINLNYYLSPKNHKNLNAYAFFINGLISGKSYRVLEGTKFIEETYVAGNLVKSINQRRERIPNTTAYRFEPEVKTYQLSDKKEGELKKIIDKKLNEFK